MSKVLSIIFLVSITLLSIGCDRLLNLAASIDKSTILAVPTHSPLPSISDENFPEKTPTDSLDPFENIRHNMVASTIESRGINSPDVLRAMRGVKRHNFVPDNYISQAYEDHPIPIGYGQTISQPYIVALMTDLLELKEGEKVLEIGTGSGYQAAVLAELGYVDVYSIEIIPELASIAAARLETQGYESVKVKQADGYYGWTDYTPYDAIIVTAAPDHLPALLAQQLRDGGRLVIPIGPPGGYQTLWKFVKENGDLKAYNLGGVAFVPFTGEGIEQSGD